MTPALVQHRVDWLTLAYQVDAVDWPALDLRVQEAQEQKQTLSYSGRPGGYAVAISASSKPGTVNWQTGDAHGQLCRYAAGEWVLEVRVRPIVLAIDGLERAIDLGEQIAGCFGRVRDRRVRRVDLATDWAGWGFADDEYRRWIAWSATRVTEHAKFDDTERDEVEGEGGEALLQLTSVVGYPSGIVVGRGDLQCRIYDKTRELKVKGNLEKIDLENQVWRANGWDGESRVVRVEFQLRGQVLSDLDIRDPKKLRANLGHVWGYCTEKWLRLAVPDTASRRSRWQTDPRWESVRAVAWGTMRGIAVRVRKRASVLVGQVVGVIRSYLGGTGALRGDPKFPPGCVREIVRGMPPEQVQREGYEAWLALCRDVFHGAYAEMREEYGDAELLVRLQEGNWGTVARFARSG